MSTYEPRLAPLFSQLIASREAACQAQSDSYDAQHPGRETREQLQEARRRLADQRFGRCETCQAPISLRRLITLPATPYCAECQTRNELQQPLAVRRLTLHLKKGNIP